MNAVKAWLRAGWARGKRDVWDDPTIRPTAAVLLSLLALLIVWLTITYAPKATHGGGEISEQWGLITVAIVTVLTLVAGLEPFLARRAERWWGTSGQSRFRRLSPAAQFSLRFFGAVAQAPPKIASVAWSLFDYLLVRLVALIAGTAWRGPLRRYTHFALLIVAVIVLALGAPPSIGLSAILVGLLVVVAVVRRWTWVEADRETFLIERGERDETELEAVKRRPTEQQFRAEVLLASASAVVLTIAVWGLRPWLHFPITLYALAPLALLLLVILGFATARIWIDPGPSAQRNRV